MRSAAISDPGMVRKVNEDSFLRAGEHGLFAVADGMGGHACGDRASSIAVETLRKKVETSPELAPGEMLKQAVQAANHAITQEAASRPEARGMGTTIVVGLVRNRTLHFAWVGDSRIYHLRDGVLHQLTMDHSLVAELCARGIITPEEARHHHQRNIITRACGTAENVEVDVGSPLSLQPGDGLLFCSDGLTAHLEDDEIQGYMAEQLHDLDLLCTNLVETTNARGGSDNVTLVIVAFDND